jgi:hypothetical protein
VVVAVLSDGEPLQPAPTNATTARPRIHKYRILRIYMLVGPLFSVRRPIRRYEWLVSHQF